MSRLQTGRNELKMRSRIPREHTKQLKDQVNPSLKMSQRLPIPFPKVLPNYKARQEITYTSLQKLVSLGTPIFLILKQVSMKLRHFLA